MFDGRDSCRVLQLSVLALIVTVTAGLTSMRSMAESEQTVNATQTHAVEIRVGSRPVKSPDESVRRIVNNVLELFDEIGRGSSSLVQRFFGRRNGEPFEAFGMGVKDAAGVLHVGFSTRDLGQLKTFLAGRARHRENLKLSMIDVTALSNGNTGVSMSGLRSADDIPASPCEMFGKAEIDRATGLLVVLSIGCVLPAA